MAIIALTCSAKVICIGEPNITPIERMMRTKVPGSFYFADENRCDTIIGEYRVSNYLCQDSSHITLYGGVDISASKDTCIIKIPLFISDTDTYDMFRLRYYHGNYDFCEIDEVIGGSDEAWENSTDE